MTSAYNEESLIENVRAHKSLYDVFTVEYKDQNIRKEAWQEIGEALGIPAEQCKSEWTKLRNCFLNSIRRRRNKTSGQSANYIPPWKFSKQMEFLLPFLENRETHSNIEVHNQEIPILPEPEKDQLSNIELNHGLSTEKNDPQKRKKSNYTEEMVEIMRSNSIFRREKYEKKAHMNYDEVELFYLSMAKIAKRLPKAKEAKLRMEVCNKVSQAELAHLLEVESIQKPQVSNQNQVLSHQNTMHYQNHSSLFQPPISRLYEESNRKSSPSTYSDQSNQSNDSHEEQNYRSPPPNHFFQPNFDHSNSYIEKNSSNQYDSL